MLINNDSASASEIVAGALADHDRARVIGERSFGKGSVQELRPIEGDNGLLKITTRYYFLPSGRHIQRPRLASDEAWGVDPSRGCVVPEDITAARERIRVRRPYEAVGGEYLTGPDVVDEAWVVETLKDAPLGEAVTLMRQRITDGQWPALEEDEDPAFSSTMVQLETLMDRREEYVKAMTELDDEINRLEGIAGTPDRGLGLDDDQELKEPVIAIYDNDGNLIGRWKVGADDDLNSSLSAVELFRQDQTDTTESDDSTEQELE